METIYILIPIYILIGCILITLINKNDEINFYCNYIGTFIIYIIYSILYINLDYTLYIKQYSIPIYNFLDMFGNYELCIDGLSSMFLLLTAFLFPLCFLYNKDQIINKTQYSILLLLVELLLIICFTASNFFIFYIAFEIILFPMVFIIGFWGSRGRRVHAVYLFFFYTMLGSFILLACLFIIFNAYGTLEFNHLYNTNNLTKLQQQLLSFFIFLGFSIKIPMYPLHLWLPEAHVEAPTVGSVILAGILLKLGGYGMLRVFMPISKEIINDLKYYFITIALVSIIFGAIAAFRQVDLKKVIAYSSVVHMNVGLLGLFTEYNGGIIGFIFLMVSHGIISAGLFFGVGMLYDRLHTKNFGYLGGLGRLMPKFALLFFLLVLANMSLPGTSNFIGEISVFFALINEKIWIISLLAIISSFFTTLFCLIIIIQTIYSYLYQQLIIIYDLNNREIFILSVCVFLIFCLGIFPGILTDSMTVYGHLYQNI